MIPKLGQQDPIIVDVDALRRIKPEGALDLSRGQSVRRDVQEVDDTADDDPLAAVIALARRKTRR
jgi:hypothetical protein